MHVVAVLLGPRKEEEEEEVGNVTEGVEGEEEALHLLCWV